MFIKFKSLDVEKGRDITVTVDLSDIRECISYGVGYRGVVTTHWAEYTVTSDECERIEALLMPADEAEAKAPEWGTLKFESNLLMHVAEAYDAYKFCPMEDKNTQDSRPLRNVLIAAGNIYAARNNGEFNPYPFLATAPQADEAKAPADSTEYFRGRTEGFDAAKDLLPDDVKDAYQRYSAMCHQMDIVFSDASWLDARVSIIQAVAAHMPQQENKTDE